MKMKNKKSLKRGISCVGIIELIMGAVCYGFVLILMFLLFVETIEGM